MTIFIKNMVCNRCITAVRKEFDKLRLPVTSITLGEVCSSKVPTKKNLDLLKQQLAVLGFEVLDDSRKKLIERIKTIIIDYVHYDTVDKEQNFSGVLSKKLNKDYSYLSGLFSEVEGITIEKYMINQKIEKVKEFIIYDEMNLSEIAYKLGYSSIAYLSVQFKKVTGLTPTHFKKAGGARRKTLDSV